MSIHRPLSAPGGPDTAIHGQERDSVLRATALHAVRASRDADGPNGPPAIVQNPLRTGTAGTAVAPALQTPS